ncbi:MAG: hypothetical protein M1825_001010 [Sarcosagium campestre]|nr:MAG: hypothetical protein M1825_001010 [Sarcosagium campestre]
MKPFRELNFDLDGYLDPHLPRSRLDRLPNFISHFLGVRNSNSNGADADSDRNPDGNVVEWFWGFIGAFSCIALIEVVLRHCPYPFQENEDLFPRPMIIASFGAAVILEFSAINSPLSQPRNLVLGQILATTSAIAITKLLALSPQFDDHLHWLAGALSVAVASLVMGVSKTTHPPAGATALLAAVDPALQRMGWYFLVPVLISTALVLALACLLNNIQRRFPLYWWSFGAGVAGVTPSSPSPSPLSLAAASSSCAGPDVEKEAASSSSETSRSEHEPNRRNDFNLHLESLSVSADGVKIPPGLQLDDEETAVLHRLSGRMKQGRT